MLHQPARQVTPGDLPAMYSSTLAASQVLILNPSGTSEDSIFGNFQTKLSLRRPFFGFFAAEVIQSTLVYVRLISVA